jgi:hypothetical protein
MILKNSSKKMDKNFLPCDTTLTIEQQFQLEILTSLLLKASREQLIEICLEGSKTLYIKDNLIKGLIHRLAMKM